MPHTPCTDPTFVSEQAMSCLLEAAIDAIHTGIDARKRAAPSSASPSPHVQQLGATFVTLHQNSSLRGCIGSIERRRKLIDDVRWNAYSATFEDPRFAPLHEVELHNTALDISVLSTPEPCEFSDHESLLNQLRIGHDGVILKHGGASATYLPSVWRLIPEPAKFIAQLRSKAGIPPAVPTAEITVLRYSVQHSPSVSLARTSRQDS